MSRIYGVVGNPVRHSRSPWLHAHFARQTQRDIVYAAYSPPPDGFADFAGDFFARGGDGLNVTIPFKADACRFADRASAFVQRAGVANVLCRRGREIAAYNTDGAGFLRDVNRYLPAGMTGRRVVLLGAGGAARAVAFVIAETKPADFWIVNRTAARAQELAELTGATALPDYPEDAEIIINATAAGFATEAPVYPPSFFSTAALAYDLSYGAAAASFLAAARTGGAAAAVDGVGMLVWQAALSFAIWESVLPSSAAAIKLLQSGSNNPHVETHICVSKKVNDIENQSA